MNEQKILEATLYNIAAGVKHPEYKKTVDIAKHWHSIISGKGQEEIVLKIRQKDSDKQKEQRIRLFKTHTPHIANRIKTVFEEVDRCDSIRQTLEVKKDIEEEAIEEKTMTSFNDQISKFFQGKSIDHYLDERLYETAALDPNSYLLINFFPFNREAGETPVIYPTIYKSSEVFQKQYDHKGLKFICFKTPMKKIEKKNQVKILYRYLLFTEDYSYEVFDAEVVEELNIDVVRQKYTRTTITVKGSTDQKEVELYYKQFTHNSKRVPVVKFGYYETAIESYEVTESHLLPAKYLFNEHIEKKSTYDNHVALYGFIRAYFYEQRCEHKVEGKPCNGGYIGNTNDVCPKCDGTGLKNKTKIARNEQEIVSVEIPLPSSNPEAGDIMDLSKLMHFVEIPEQIFKMNREELDKLEQGISLSMFNTNIFNRQELVAGVTATEIKERLKAVNNVLYKYAQHKARVWRFIVEQVAIYHGILDKMDISREYPSDFKLETINELLALLKSAKESGASADVVRKIEEDILVKQYADQPDRILWIRAKNKFRPFYTKSDAEAMATVAMLPANDPKRVLYVFFDDIFAEIESAERLKTKEEGKDKVEPRFYAMPYPEQKEIVDQKVQEYSERIPEAQKIEQQPF